MSIEKDSGGPAFPAPVEPKTDWSLRDVTSGMTLRDWFAGKALQGLLASGDEQCEAFAEAAHYSYAYADAMLAERSK